MKFAGMDMLTPKNTLICIFSYNMGATLERCIQSTIKMCAGFEMILIDDASEDPRTVELLKTQRHLFREVIVSREPKLGKRHGNLYLNIQKACAYATQSGFKFLMMIQDDMQFVRPFDENIGKQYGDLFNSGDKVLQVDPRFLRRGEYEVLKERHAYRYDTRTSYADVGIVHLGRLNGIKWQFLEGERANKQALTDLGYERLFPFTPITMHVPFPRVYRGGRGRFRVFPFNRGKYGFAYMTEQEMADMDARPVEQVPFFRAFLRPYNMRLSRLLYWYRKDNKIFT